MKKIVMIATGIFLSATIAFAQEYKTKLANSKDRKVTIEMAGGDIKIEGHNSDDVIIQTSSAFEAIPERAKGLKPMYYNAVDNSGIGLSVTSENGGLKIEKATRKEVKYTIKLPRKVAVLFQETNWQGSNITVSNMDGDLEIKTNGANINLNNVTGPIVANTISGEVNVVYATLNQEKPTAISSISGEIDVSLPASAKSNLNLRSITGEMFTDFDLGVKNTKNGMTKVGGNNNIEGNINGGGVEIQLKTISSNIYIRKQK